MTVGRTGELAPEFVAAAARLGVAVIAGEPLARHTTFRIGGPADLYATAGEPGQLEALATLAAQFSLPVTVLGGGSNVLISDAGIRGLVIGNTCREIRREPGSAGVIAEAGAALAGLARWTMREGLSGLEWAVSVPGTVGGAVIGNAGAHGSDVAGTLSWALVAYPGQSHQVMQGDALAFAYRSSLLKRRLAEGDRPGGPGDGQPVVLAAAFDLAEGDAAEMTARAESYLARRRATQPVEPSAGSVFRNPPGDHAGRLIEAAGLKGHRIGGAQISPRHANFIVNTGNARAGDVRSLIELMQTQVRRQFGIALLPEILFLGEWASTSSLKGSSL